MEQQAADITQLEIFSDSSPLGLSSLCNVRDCNERVKALEKT